MEGRIEIPVLGSGPGRIFVDKPAGLSVHNDSGKDLCSLVKALVVHDSRLRRRTAYEPDFGVHPVHRLDRETSGVVLLSVTRDRFRFYAEQFENREASKVYAAVLHGNLEGPGTESAWKTWRWPLSKRAGGRSNPAGPGKRLPCETRYRVIDRSEHYTMLEVEILSGRTHQIRRHAKLAGHPVVGDARYGSTRATRYLQENLRFDRLALHARSLTLRMEPGKQAESVETKKVPDVMTRLFQDDRITVEPVDPRAPEIVRMIKALDAYQASLYPPESNHLVDVANLAGPDYHFIAAFDRKRPLAIASFKRTGRGYVEIKRLYVPEAYRGRHLGRRLMHVLEKAALREGIAEARLETGIHQHAAIALYEKLGYARTSPFGAYKEDPLSVFMRKKLRTYNPK